MKAIVHTEYGSPDLLKLEEIDVPPIGDDQVLVKVRAASVNPLDWHYLRGKPYVVRAQSGIRRPKNTGSGADLAGTVETVGADVLEFQPGDEVYGQSIRTFAEYVRVSPGAIVRKPANLTFEQAAAVPVAGFTALQGLRDKGHIRPGQKVLMIGAAGGVGTFAVQIAKSYGAEVTGVCSTRNVDLVRSIGADLVIDYTEEDFARGGPDYDLIFELAGSHSRSSLRRILNANGTLVLCSAPEGNWLAPIIPMVAAVVSSRFSSQRVVTFLARRTVDDLNALRELIESGAVTPVIDRTYPLSEVPEAIRYLEEGHARGKVVITI
jgi:NADPH:quinone reductase-like Zn-dependent oxidoreductase